MKARDILIALWIKSEKDWDKTYHSLRNKEYFDVEPYLEGVDTSKFVTILDEEYPRELLKGFRPPFVLERKDRRNI